MVLEGKHFLVISSVYPETTDANHGAFIREVIVRSQQPGVKFTVFAPAYEGSKSHELDGVQVYRFRYFLKRFENLVRDGAPTKLKRQPIYLFVAALYILLGTCQLFWVCCKEKPDLLHVNWPFPHGLMALPASKLLGIPMVFSFHGAELLLANRFGFVAHILRWMTPMSAVVTANSSFTKGLICKLYDGPVDIIPYGMTIEAKPSKQRPPGADPRILFVGRLDERKGLRYLLAALPTVLTHQPVQLRIVGKGILESEIKAQCTALGLDHVVEFLGFVTKEQLADEYASCDIFVLPAIIDSKGDTEGLGIVMIEALAHEKPVIASAVGGIVDVIHSSETGLLVPQKDPSMLAEAIVTLLSHPEQAHEMGRRGFQDVQSRFSWSRITPLWQQTFSEALGINENLNTKDQLKTNTMV
ncbi:MAG: glycosyltransferase family 4 protein [Desmonostoc vinosum HA7617-LM4]|jgi:glycosyltransferase involved in cell wall biosynthesis|nr:glycosyltransferase family 4 protein [Desmonostoc vinosum HA7617-LM4]